MWPTIESIESAWWDLLTPDTVDRPRHALIEPGDRTSHRVGLVCACGAWSNRTSDDDARAAWKTHADERTAAA